MSLPFSFKYNDLLSKSLEARYQQFSSEYPKLLFLIGISLTALTLSYIYPLSALHLVSAQKSKLIVTMCFNVVFLVAFYLVLRKAAISPRFFRFKDKVIILLTTSVMIMNYELFWIYTRTTQTDDGGLIALFILALLPSTFYVALSDKIIHWALILGYYGVSCLRLESSLLSFLIALNLAFVIMFSLHTQSKKQREYIGKALDLDLLLQIFNLGSAQTEKAYMLVNRNFDLVFANEHFYKVFELNSSHISSEKLNEIFRDIIQVSGTANLVNIIGEQESEYFRKQSVKSTKGRENDTEFFKKTSITKGQIFKTLIGESQEDCLKTLVRFFFEYAGVLKQFNIGWNRTKNAPVFYPAIAYYDAQQFYLQLAYLTFGQEDLVLIEITTGQNPKDFSSTPSNLSMTDIASIIHEVRTPLNGTIFLTQQALENSQVPDDVKNDLLLPSLISSRRLWYLVNDILDFAQILEGKFKLTLETFDLYSALNHSLQIIVALAKAKELKVYLEIDPKVPRDITTDQNRLVQIVYNLMGNAIKFTKEGYVKLSVTPSPKEPRYIDFTVQDTGYGIKPTDLKKLFRVFEKLDNWHDNKIGSGLGLSIGNALAKVLGKQITVTSEYKKGSTFRFSIENRETTLSIPKTSEARSPGRSPRLSFEGMDKIPDFELALDRRSRLISVDETKAKSSLEITSIFDHHRIGLAFNRKESNEIMMDLPDSKNKTVHFDFNFPSTHIQSATKRKDDTYRIKIDPGIDEALKEDEDTTEFGYYNRSNSGLPFLTNKLDNSNMALPSPISVSRCQCFKIFGVDDEPINVIGLQFTIREVGLKAKFFNSGDAIIEYIGNNYDQLSCNNCKGPLFILMDCFMPHKDGFQTTEELKEIMNKYKLRIPIIACTADESEDIDIKVKEYGMIERVAKPIQRFQLEDMIQRYTLMQHFVDIDDMAGKMREPDNE